MRVALLRTVFASISLACLGLTSLGCRTIGTTSVAPEKQVEQTRESALTSRNLSADSQQLLRLALLDELAREEPKLAVRSLVALYDRRWGLAGTLAPATAAAELAVVEARRLEVDDPAASAGYYLTAADLAQQAVLRALDGDISPLGPRLRFAAELYNFACSRLAMLGRDLIFSSASDTGIGWPSSYSAEIEGPLGIYELSLAGDISLWNPRIFLIRPADEIEVRGLRNRHRSHGLGAPLVITRRELPRRTVTRDGFFRSHWNFYALSAIARFEDAAPREEVGRHRRARLELHDPLEAEEIDIDGRALPLEADFTAPMAVLAEMVQPQQNERQAALRAENFLDEAGIYTIEPYRPDKIPLVLVHGLNSSALTWLELSNDLRGDAELRRRYQIWAFNYPTGLPFSISTAMLRQSLENMLDHFDPDRGDEAIRQMVMIGHSMGGLVTRAQATDAGTVLWDAVALRPFEEADLEPEDEALLRRAYLPEPLPELSRAIFIAAPHRGSPLAAGGLGRLASRLVKIPSDLRAQFIRLTGLGVLSLPEEVEAPDVIDSLSAESPIIRAYARLPVTVPFHTIIGDRFPDSDSVSDGFVTLESASLDGAQSELVIVGAGHNSHKSAQAAAEVRRILVEHLRQVDGP